jgi:hypothetical protein
MFIKHAIHIFCILARVVVFAFFPGLLKKRNDLPLPAWMKKNVKSFLA